jgi:hypothetical protein
MPNFVANLWHRVKKCDMLRKLANSALYHASRAECGLELHFLLQQLIRLARKEKRMRACKCVGKVGKAAYRLLFGKYMLPPQTD